MERRFQYYVPFTNHTQYRARARAREHNNTMEKFILNFTHLFHSMSTRYERTHIYIEDICIRGLDARGGRKLRTDTHTHMQDSQSDDNNKDYSVFEVLKLNRYNTTYTHVCKTAQHEAHALI